LVEEEEEKRDDSTEDSAAFIPDNDDDEEDDDDESDVDELFLSLMTSGSNCSICIMMALRLLINGGN